MDVKMFQIERDKRVTIIDGTQRDAFDIVMNELKAWQT